MEHYCPALLSEIRKCRKEKDTSFSFRDVDYSVFKMFVQWIYRQSIGLWGLRTKAERDSGERVDDNFLKGEYLTLVKLWIFGNKYDIRRLQNYVITKLIAVQQNVSHTAIDAFGYIYANTEVDSKLRTLAVAQCYAQVPEFEFFYAREKFPEELLLDLAALSAKLRAVKDKGTVKLKAKDYFVSTASNDKVER
jgi:hypothetical protein